MALLLVPSTLLDLLLFDYAERFFTFWRDDELETAEILALSYSIFSLLAKKSGVMDGLLL